MLCLRDDVNCKHRYGVEVDESCNSIVTHNKAFSAADEGTPCSHFYGWKITQEFEHKFLGV